MIYYFMLLGAAALFSENDEYTSEIVPHIDECIYLPHRGTYKIREILYSISDDIIRQELDNIIIYGSNATCMSEEQWNRLPMKLPPQEKVHRPRDSV